MTISVGHPQQPRGEQGRVAVRTQKRGELEPARPHRGVREVKAPGLWVITVLH